MNSEEMDLGPLMWICHHKKEKVIVNT
jgi:hypothetical protein